MGMEIRKKPAGNAVAYIGNDNGRGTEIRAGFQGAAGGTIGYIGNDNGRGVEIKNSGYSTIGYIGNDNGRGVEIKNSSYSTIGYIGNDNGNGAEIKDANYNTIGYAVGSGTIAQKGAAAFVLLGMLTPEEVSGEKPGCLSRIIGAILGAIVAMVLHSWPGRIGVLYGLAFGILGNMISHGGVGTAIFLSVFLMLICGLLGLLAGFISSKLSRHGNFGALIGSGITGIALAVIAIIGKMNLSYVFLFFLLGVVPGLVAGAIVGGIVGLIIKKK